VFVSVEAVCGTDQTGNDQNVAEQFVGKGRRIAQNPAGENLPDTKYAQSEHGQSHEEAHKGVENLFKFFQGFISSNDLLRCR
jgi:hypothetical protein